LQAKCSTLVFWPSVCPLCVFFFFNIIRPIKEKEGQAYGLDLKAKRLTLFFWSPIHHHHLKYFCFKKRNAYNFLFILLKIPSTF